MRHRTVLASLGALGLVVAAWLGTRLAHVTIDRSEAEARWESPTQRHPVKVGRPRPPGPEEPPLGEDRGDRDTQEPAELAPPSWDEVSDLPEEMQVEVRGAVSRVLQDLEEHCAPGRADGADRLVASVSLRLGPEGLASLSFGSIDLDHPSARPRDDFPRDLSACAHAVLREQEWPMWERELRLSFVAPLMASGGDPVQ